jgi:hypothetical protein
MKKQKQLDTLACLHRYIITDDNIFGRQGKPLSRNNINGYYQLHLYNGRRGIDGIDVMVYLHIVLYLYHKGEYPEGWQIDHIDSNKDNLHYSNLEAKTCLDNNHNRMQRDVINGNQTKIIRDEEIKAIRCYHIQGKSQSWIARELDLGRLAVRYTIKKIEKGESFKFELAKIL